MLFFFTQGPYRAVTHSDTVPSRRILNKNPLVHFFLSPCCFLSSFPVVIRFTCFFLRCASLPSCRKINRCRLSTNLPLVCSVAITNIYLTYPELKILTLPLSYCRRYCRCLGGKYRTAKISKFINTNGMIFLCFP